MTTKITRRRALAAGFGLAVATARLDAAPVPKVDPNPSWVGKTVLPRKFATRALYPAPAHLEVPPSPDGTPAMFARVLDGASYEVKAEKGTRVEVFEGDLACWIEKADIVPLADAVEFFTAALKASEKDTFALTSRGWAYHLLSKPEKALADFDLFLKLTPPEPATPSGVPARWEGLVNRGLVLAEKGEFEKALTDLDEAVTNWPAVAIARVNRGYTRELMGDYAKAVADYSEVTHLLATNNLAWVRATCPDAKFRNGAEAVRLAQRVCEATANREGMYLDTLAAGFAEAGRFADAVKAQEKALEDKSYVIRFGPDGHKRLQLYKDKKPFRTEPVKK
jgi:tetratricopeptide (TPR) repeat protein